MNTEMIILEKNQIHKATEIMVDAFNQDPMFQYIEPENVTKKEKISFIFWNSTLELAQNYQHIYTTKDIKGIAAWMPPEVYPMGVLDILKLLRLGFYKMPFTLGFEGLKRFLPLFELMDKYHSQNMHQPHWYLFGLGVSSSSQGQGIGRSLIQPILNRADAEGLPCYLETFTEKGVHFYQKNDFEVVITDEKIAKFWTMKREPNI